MLRRVAEAPEAPARPEAASSAVLRRSVERGALRAAGEFRRHLFRFSPFNFEPTSAERVFGPAWRAFPIMQVSGVSDEQS
jgi:hypothetical protein